MYADDVQFLHLELPENLKQLQTRVQSTLENAQQWFTDNSLKISSSKTALVLVKQTEALSSFEVQFGEARIKSSDKVKF